MYLLIRDTMGYRQYFDYDRSGRKTWTTRRLDGVRFARVEDAHECCEPQFAEGARLIRVGRDGETVIYHGAELEIYIKAGFWRFRVSTFNEETKEFHFDYSPKRMNTASRAMASGRSFIDRGAILPV